MILDMLSRQSPNVVSKIEFTPDPEVIKIYYINKPFELNSQNFFLGIRLTDYAGVPIVN